MDKLLRDGVALAYEEEGDGDPPLLLVHCWCGDHTFMAPQREHFSTGHRVVSVDLRGHGESDKPVQDYTVAGFADDLVWLCGQLGVEKPVVIGHSMGGNIALELAASYPDFPSAIAVLESIILPSSELSRILAQGGEALRGPEFQSVARSLVDGVCLATDNAARKERIKEVMASAPQHVMSSAFDQHILLWDGAAAAAACQVPVLYVGGANPPTDTDRLRELCPQVAIGQTVGAGHFNNQEVPEQVNAMIERFLTLNGLHEPVEAGTAA